MRCRLWPTHRQTSRIPDRRHISAHRLFILWSFPMSKMLKSIVGLAIISSAIGLAAAPAKAESKAAQCQRFGQSMVTFSRQLAAVQSQSNRDLVPSLDRWLQTSNQGLKRMQSMQFSDPKIRGFQQTALNVYVDLHNTMSGLADALERHDRDGARNAYQGLFTAIQPETQLKQDYRAYCGRPK
jgi:hypothetical protein